MEAIRDLIENAIEADAPVTVRGVFYRVSSAGGVPKTENGYRTVQRLVLQMRREGRINYRDIADGSRWVLRPTTHDSLTAMLNDTRAMYRRSLWRDQDVEVHVYSEKDAISGVLYPVTREWDVPLAIVRGYSSETFAYSLGEAVAGADKPVYVYQFGDHDPSGVGAWEDIAAKVEEFSQGAEVYFERLAVRPEQIAQYGLQTRPTKATDTRSRRFAGESVEVDAIPAPELRSILRRAIERHIDADALHVTKVAEQSEKDIIGRIIGRLDDEEDLWS